MSENYQSSSPKLTLLQRIFPSNTPSHIDFEDGQTHLITRIVSVFSMADRIRILISGKTMTEVHTILDAETTALKDSSVSYVLPPNHALAQDKGEG